MKRPLQSLFNLVASWFSPNAGRAEPLAIGAAMPVVSQQDQNGNTVSLDPAAKGWVLVYFYPKADTPGCTKQACSLRDAFADLTDLGLTIYGVSADSVAAQKGFKDKYQLPFQLLADADGRVVSAFGVPKLMGFAKRQAFLFKDGHLVWRDLAAATARQADDVRNVIEEHAER